MSNEKRGEAQAPKRIKLTRPFIDAAVCPPGKAQALHFDSEQPGLGLRVTPSGAKSFIFQARLGNETIRLTIGDARMSIRSSRRAIGDEVMGADAEAARLMAMVRRGEDPRQVKRERIAASQAQREADRVERARKKVLARDAWGDYCRARSEGGARGKQWSPRHLDDHRKMAKAGGEPHRRAKGRFTQAGILHDLLQQPLADLDQAAVARWLEAAALRSPTQTALAFRLLRAFLAWCSESDAYPAIAVSDACASRRIKQAVPAVQPKKGALMRGELEAWFRAAQDDQNRVAAAYLQCLLLTGARPNELIDLTWDKVDGRRSVMTIRDKVDRATRERSIPMTPYVAQTIEALPRRGVYVFASDLADVGHISPPSRIHSRILKRAGLQHVSLHDLRRTFAKMAELLGLSRSVAEQMEGRSKSDVRGRHYTQDLPMDFMLDAMSVFEQKLLAMAGLKAPIDGADMRLRLVSY